MTEPWYSHFLVSLSLSLFLGVCVDYSLEDHFELEHMMSDNLPVVFLWQTICCISGKSVGVSKWMIIWCAELYQWIFEVCLIQMMKDDLLQDEVCEPSNWGYVTHKSIWSSWWWQIMVTWGVDDHLDACLYIFKLSVWIYLCQIIVMNQITLEDRLEYS